MIPLPSEIARRTFLKRSGISLGGMALGTLLQQSVARADAKLVGDDRWQGVLQPLHFAPRAKRVIWLYMAGGMTHIDTFDNKPKLAELHGKPMPESVTAGQQIAQLQGQQHLQRVFRILEARHQQPPQRNTLAQKKAHPDTHQQEGTAFLNDLDQITTARSRNPAPQAAQAAIQLPQAKLSCCRELAAAASSLQNNVKDGQR
jgi:hypothetical protein